MIKRVYDTDKVSLNDNDLKNLLITESICDGIGEFSHTSDVRENLNQITKTYVKLHNKIRQLSENGYTVNVVNGHLCVVNSYNSQIELVAELD